MVTEDLVSVVVPTYGRPESIVEAVSSVREQTYERVELVVVDDHSPDPVEPRVRSLNLDRFEAVQCIRHDENRGAPAARRTGIEAASGRYVAFLDDDDAWEPDKLERQIGALESAGADAGVAYCGMRVVDGSGETIRTQVADVSGDVTKTLLCRNVVGSYTNVLVRAAAIDDVGPPNEDFPTWQDLEWYVRLSTAWEFVAVPEPLSIVTQEDDRDHISDDYQAIRSETYPLFVEKFRPLAAEYGPLFERKMLGWAAFRVGAYNALRTGHYRDARRLLARAVVKWPFEPAFWLYLGVAIGGNRIHRVATGVKRALTE